MTSHYGTLFLQGYPNTSGKRTSASTPSTLSYSRMSLKWLGVIAADSCLETVCWVTPRMTAICCCVYPALLRAFLSCERMVTILRWSWSCAALASGQDQPAYIEQWLSFYSRQCVCRRSRFLQGVAWRALVLRCPCRHWLLLHSSILCCTNKSILSKVQSFLDANFLSNSRRYLHAQKIIYNNGYFVE